MPDLLTSRASQPELTSKKGSSLLQRVNFRPYHTNYRQDVFTLLNDLPTLYPNGLEWLDGKLDDVAENQAECTLAVVDSNPIGLLIETPKGRGKRKLSTLYVSEHFRGSGIGTELLNRSRSRWLEKSLDYVYITVAYQNRESVTPILKKFNFEFIDLQSDRYGPQRDELIFGWYR